MKTIKSLSILWIALLIISTNSFAQKNNKDIVDFKLKNVDGNFVSLSDYPTAKGFIIVFTCNHCPFAKLYPPRLNDLNNKFKPLGVPLIAISSTDTMMYEEDTYPNMVIKANEEHFNFPYLFDEMQEVAKNFKAQKTPHAFVIWKENNQWIIKYNGAIDDNGMEPNKVTETYVSNAVNELLTSQTIKTSETKSIGCQIAFRKK
jgi:peroxiredoxin